MIAYVEGRILDLGESYLVIQVGSVGLQIFVPSPLRARSRAGENVVLFTYLIVREDLLALYGFESPVERDIFGLLLGVNGIGPRLALNILSVLSVDAIRRVILSEQPEVLSRVPGVGKKNAQKIILSLQGKVTGEGLEGVHPIAEVDQEVLEALTSLGYSVVEAQTAVQSIPRDAPMELEERLKLALRYFSP
ncbi:Holliday junction branch migration protein RuvA [Anaerolinea sp.]|uniref:Holliday junction branch migration protein RuvA n=1 Tax=Anaerolinea sp. TaxID=1872519 RepID=UPI00260B34A0|nr:Holliday junction branch migration protein RuvA [uncultured Anaerolinea sp.]